MLTRDTDDVSDKRCSLRDCQGCAGKGGIGVRELTRGLATLFPKVDPGAFKTPTKQNKTNTDDVSDDSG